MSPILNISSIKNPVAMLDADYPEVNFNYFTSFHNRQKTWKMTQTLLFWHVIITHKKKFYKCCLHFTRQFVEVALKTLVQNYRWNLLASMAENNHLSANTEYFNIDMFK